MFFYRGKELEKSLPPLIFIPKYFLYRTENSDCWKFYHTFTDSIEMMDQMLLY